MDSKIITKVCPRCHAKFSTAIPNKVYCTPKCAKAAEKKRARELKNKRQEAEPQSIQLSLVECHRLKQTHCYHGTGNAKVACSKCKFGKFSHLVGGGIAGFGHLCTKHNFPIGEFGTCMDFTPYMESPKFLTQQKESQIMATTEDKKSPNLPPRDSKGHFIKVNSPKKTAKKASEKSSNENAGSANKHNRKTTAKPSEANQNSGEMGGIAVSKMRVISLNGCMKKQAHIFRIKIAIYSAALYALGVALGIALGIAIAK